MDSEKESIFNNETREVAEDFFEEILKIGSDFKLQETFRKSVESPLELKNKIIKELDAEGQKLSEILSEFTHTILPDCSNFSSSAFMGFPDSGNSIAGIGGALMSDFLQQNLINQSFCAPSATFVEIAVLEWLRKTVGYNVAEISDIWDVGGIVTYGGTVSNTIAMMLARENKVPGTIETGIQQVEKFKIVVPKGIGHYSVKSAQRWLGCGNQLIEVPTVNFRYDLNELENALKGHKGNIMAVVAYAGDSRTMTIDNLRKIADLTRTIDPSIWLHADACHGFSLGFSHSLKSKIDGIQEFDSISTDPHKVMLIPYTLSTLLVKDPKKLKTITSLSDLIMQESFAFGQITPFIGSKPWASLKLWFMMKNFGWNGLDKLITSRHATAKKFQTLIENNNKFKTINKVDFNAVAFMYTGGRDLSIEKLNTVNREIHSRLLKEGRFHLHQFSIPDPGIFQKDAVIYPLRFMSGNPNITESNMKELINSLEGIGEGLI